MTKTNLFSKEAITAGFYIIYLLIAYLLSSTVVGNEKAINLGILLFFLLIPISFIYAFYHVVKHFNSQKSYIFCLLIHAVAWFSIISFLTNYKK